MFKKFVCFILVLSLVLFAGCVSQNKYMAMESELNTTRTQMEEEKKSYANLQDQNETLNNENRQLLELIEDLKLELENQKIPAELMNSKHPEPGTFSEAMHRPYSILLSSCRRQESVEKVLSEYKEGDLEPYVVKVDLGEKGSWWRIFAGHYGTREGALIEMNKHGLTDKIVLKASNAQQIDGYNGEYEASNKISFLLKNSVDPYSEGY